MGSFNADYDKYISDNIRAGMMPEQTMKIWSTALDGGSCSLCAKLQWTAVKHSQPFVFAGRSVMTPPLHDGCRCAIFYEENPKPQLRRDYDTFMSFAAIANDSDMFSAVVNSYFAALYFLQNLVDASPADLRAAGLSIESGASLRSQMDNIKNHQDDIFNAAIKRDYDRTWSDAQSLKTERGKKTRMDAFLQSVLSSQVLSDANQEYLYCLMKG